MSEALNRLAASAAAMTSVAASAVAVINGISQQIREAIEEDDAQEDGALGQLADSLDASAHDLSAAIEANTPAASPVLTGGDVPGAGLVTPTPEPAPAETDGVETPPAGEPDSETLPVEDDGENKSQPV